MRLTSAQVEDLLKKIIDEDPEYQTELIQDRIKEHQNSNPKLLERLTEKAWDIVFVDTDIVTFDEMEADLRSEPGPVVQMPFRYVKDLVFEYIDNGGNIREYLLRKLNIVFRHLGLSGEFMENIDSPDGPWQNALNTFWVLCLLLECREKKEFDPNKWPFQEFKNALDAANWLFCEGIPKEFRPTQENEGYHYSKKQKRWKEGMIETKRSVKWEPLSNLLGYTGQTWNKIYEFYLQAQRAYIKAVEKNDTTLFSPYLVYVSELHFSESGKKRKEQIEQFTFRFEP